MDWLLAGGIILILFGASPCIFLGYLIAVKQKHSLIAGWDESRISDPKRYASVVGYSVLVLGILLGLIAIAWYLSLIGEIQMTIALLVSSLIPLPCLVYANNKYGKK